MYLHLVIMWCPWLHLYFMYSSLETIAEEIEDPFGNDANDVPTDKIALNIHKHITEIL